MRLLISTGLFYPSQIGGPGNTLYWFGKELVKKGISVKTIVSDAGVAEDFAPRDTWFDLDGIQIKYCKTGNQHNPISLVWKTMSEVSESDVVMLSSLLYKPNLFVGLAALLSGKKIIWSPRGELLVPRKGVKNLFFRLVRFLFSKRTLFHATSKEEAETIYHFMGRSANCIIIPNYMELPNKVEAKCDDKYLLYVGRIAPVKALEKLIEGIACSEEFLKQGYKLVLAGKTGGEYFDKITALVKDRGLTKHIVFKGMVEGEAKEALYAGAKVTLLVSHSENFGNVIIESLAQSTPAITSHGTPWQVLEEKNSGYWIDNYPINIGKTIDRLLLLPEEEYQQMRTNAYQLCCDEFDIKSNIHKWVNVIK